MKNLIVIIIASLLCSCAVPVKYTKNRPLNINNYKEIEGYYYAYYSKDLLNKVDSIEQGLYPTINSYKFSEFIPYSYKSDDSLQFKKLIKTYSPKHFTVNLKFLNENEIQFQYLYKDSIVETTVKKFKLKDNGFIKVKRFNFCGGIPVFLFVCDKKNTELGLTKHENLIRNEAQFHHGHSILFGYGGFNSKTMYEFQKKQTKNSLDKNKIQKNEL